MLHERIVEEREELDEHRGIAPCPTDMPTAPGQRVELHLWIEGDKLRQPRHHPLDRFACQGIDDDIDIARRPRHSIHTGGESPGEHVVDAGCLAGVGPDLVAGTFFGLAPFSAIRPRI